MVADHQKGHWSLLSEILKALTGPLVTPTCVLTCTCSYSHILFKCHEMLPGPSANSWPSTACPVSHQTDWQGSFQTGRVNGLADFGHDMITDCFHDLSNTSNISCLNLGDFPSTASGTPSSILRGLNAKQPPCHLQVRHDLKTKF